MFTRNIDVRNYLVLFKVNEGASPDLQPVRRRQVLAYAWRHGMGAA